MVKKIAWRISCCVCIALILITFIAPLAFMAHFAQNIDDTNKIGAFFYPFATLLIWLLAFPAELYIWYCLAYLFHPGKERNGKAATVFMALALALTIFVLWLIPQVFVTYHNFFDIAFPSAIAAILVCQVSAWICQAVAKRKARKKQPVTNN